MSSLPLSIINVSKKFGSQEVLKEVSFDLKKGEVFGLIGLNGVGKTTLIKGCLDLLKLDEGQIKMSDVPATEVTARSTLSYLPEKFQPPRQLKGTEYLSLALSYYKKKLDVERAKELAAMLDLDPDKLSSKISTYSKGMGQKLGLVGAFMVDQPFLILDEPMSGLDPSARIKLKKLLLAQKEAGKTVFFSSHILSDIDEICDRIGIIHDSALRYIGEPGSFKEQKNEASLEEAFLKLIS